MRAYLASARRGDEAAGEQRELLENHAGTRSDSTSLKLLASFDSATSWWRASPGSTREASGGSSPASPWKPRSSCAAGPGGNRIDLYQS
jgi:hypothetical protein